MNNEDEFADLNRFSEAVLNDELLTEALGDFAVRMNPRLETNMRNKQESQMTVADFIATHPVLSRTPFNDNKSPSRWDRNAHQVLAGLQRLRDTFTGEEIADLLKKFDWRTAALAENVTSVGEHHGRPLGLDPLDEDHSNSFQSGAHVPRKGDVECDFCEGLAVIECRHNESAHYFCPRHAQKYWGGITEARVLEGGFLFNILKSVAVGTAVNAGINKMAGKESGIGVPNVPKMAGAVKDFFTPEEPDQLKKLRTLANHPSSKGTPEGDAAQAAADRFAKKHGIETGAAAGLKAGINKASKAGEKVGLAPIKTSTWSDALKAFKQGMGEAAGDPLIPPKDALKYEKERREGEKIGDVMARIRGQKKESIDEILGLGVGELAVIGAVAASPWIASKAAKSAGAAGKALGTGLKKAKDFVAPHIMTPSKLKQAGSDVAAGFKGAPRMLGPGSFKDFHKVSNPKDPVESLLDTYERTGLVIVQENCANAPVTGTHAPAGPEAPHYALDMQEMHRKLGTLLPQLHAIVTSSNLGEERGTLTQLFQELQFAHTDLGNILSIASQIPKENLGAVLSHYSSVYEAVMAAVDPYADRISRVPVGQPYKLMGGNLVDSAK